MPQRPGLLAQQPDGGGRRVDKPAVARALLRREPTDGGRQPGAGAPQQRLDDVAQAAGVGAADVTVAVGVDQLGQGLQQLGDVGLRGRPLVQQPQQLGHGGGQVGHQGGLDAARHPGQARGVVQDAGGGGGLDGVAPA